MRLVLRDNRFAVSGDYTLAFAIAIGVSLLSALSVWRASPSKVRAVAGRLHKLQAKTVVK